MNIEAIITVSKTQTALAVEAGQLVRAADPTFSAQSQETARAHMEAAVRSRAAEVSQRSDTLGITSRSVPSDASFLRDEISLKTPPAQGSEIGKGLRITGAYGKSGTLQTLDDHGSLLDATHNTRI